MPRAEQLPRVHRYSLELKLGAGRLSKLPRACAKGQDPVP